MAPVATHPSDALSLSFSTDPLARASKTPAQCLTRDPVQSQMCDTDSQLRVLPSEFYAPLFADRANRLKGNPIRSLLPMEKAPGMISLLAGKPNSSAFPITSVTVSTIHPFGDSVDITLDGPLLEQALQYNMIAGLPDLLDWITGLQERAHHRSHSEGWRVSMGVGSQDLIFKCFQALFEDGDSVLVETPAYPGIVPLLQSMKIELIEVPTDSDGIQSRVLNDILSEWPAHKPKPKALYTVPVGNNPSGCTASFSRRLEVLSLAREHNFIILEDDPYYYLYYGSKPRPPSYFAMEAMDRSEPAGRVVRFDSLSKILSSGFRLGFVTGPDEILSIIDKQTALSNLQPSTFAQGVVLAILKSWGYDAFFAHTIKVSNLYKARRDACAAAFERHLTGLAEWDTPEAGMFLWFKLNITPDGSGEYDSAKLIQDNALKAGVIALPGVVAYPLERSSPYCRASFSVASDEELDEACRRLAGVVLEARRNST